MFQFYFKEKFNVYKFQIPSCEKMQLHLVLFAFFIYTIFKEDNTPSPVENQKDLELDFKVFFFIDSFC